MPKACFRTLGLLAALLPSIVQGQTVTSPYEFIETRHSIGLYGGSLGADPGPLDVGPRAAPILGARYNIHLTGPLSGEIGFSFAPSERTIYVPTGAPGSELRALEDRNVLLMIGEAGVRLNLTGPRTWRNLAPYVLATAGFVADLTSADALEGEIPPEQQVRIGPGFAAALGVGTDYYLTERFSIRAEARDQIWRLSYPPGLTRSGRRETEWRNNFAFTMGGAIHF